MEIENDNDNGNDHDHDMEVESEVIVERENDNDILYKQSKRLPKELFQMEVLYNLGRAFHQVFLIIYFYNL